MTKKNSRAKGSRFELDVAKAFSDAFGIELRRTPLSGGWSHSNPAVAGDLVCITEDTDFPYCVECKNAEGWMLDSLFTDKHQWFDNWWIQLIKECPEGKEPLLVFTRNRAPAYIATYDLYRISDIDVLLRFKSCNGTLICIYRLDRYLDYNKIPCALPSG